MVYYKLNAEGGMCRKLFQRRGDISLIMRVEFRVIPLDGGISSVVSASRTWYQVNGSLSLD